MLEWNLQFFAGEGGGEGGDAGETPQSAAQTAPLDRGADEGAGEPEEDRARRDEYKAYVKEHKDLYEQDLKGHLDRRMKSAAREIDQLKGNAARYENLAQALANRYGVDPTDLDGIAKAVDEDSSWLEEMAARNGLTVDQQRHINALEAENQRFKAVKAAQDAAEAANQALGQWRQEEAQLKEVYPDFDLEAEVANNQQFAELLKNHVPMQTAYQVCHMDEIMTQGMQYAVQKTKDSVAASVRANGMRPTEGAGRNNAPTKIGIDPNKLTREQRDELVKRAARGETITFG